MKQLWTELYRPSKISDYVFRDAEQRKQVQSWVDSGAIPHLLFSGVQGSGKTTLAKVLIQELDVHASDVLMINASSNNGVDYIRDTITNFTSCMPFGEFRYILLDEADYLSPNAQAALRGVMEKFSNSARFILTCNYPGKIIPAIHSRCQGFHIEKLDVQEFTARVATILITENVNVELEVLDQYVSATYPDMRKCINLCQQNSQSGELLAPSSSDSAGDSDVKLQMVALFRDRKYKEARTLICNQLPLEEYDDMFKFMYTNLNLWASNDDQESEAIIIIRNGLVKHTSCGDPEINLAATLCELEILAGG